PYNTSTLVLLQIVQRYGDITPSLFYPGDPYANDTWPDGLANLTPKGKRRMYETGRQLRHRYGQWLGVSPKTIYQRSASVNRCLESAYAVSAGMYQPEGRWVWDRPLELAHLWQPMAIQTVPTAIDPLLDVSADCPVADTLDEDQNNSPQVLAFMAAHQSFVNQLNEATGNNFTFVGSVATLYKTLVTELDYPKPPPPWLRAMGVKRTMARLEEFQRETVNLLSVDPTVQRLRGGPLIGVLIDNMNSAIAMEANSTMVKVNHYTTNDVTIAIIYRILNNKIILPSFGSALVFELHLINGSYVVKVLYANQFHGFDFDWNNVMMPNCKSGNDPIGQCTFNTFFDSLNNSIPVNWASECGLTYPVPIYPSQICRLAYKVTQSQTYLKVPDKSNAYH
ncbi:unnamed protein product, partial [Medioppia subpectinata]